MQTRTKQISAAMNFLFWIIFIGFLIKTGAVIVSFFVSLFINSEGAKNLYLGLNLSELLRYNTWHYTIIVLFIISLSALKAYISYLVIKICTKVNFDKPFSTNVSILISKISRVALGTGILALIANAYSEWLSKKNIALQLNWGSAEFLFLAGIIFIIALVFRKGIEIQSENDLTV